MGLCRLYERAKSQFWADIREDPYLVYILLLGLALAGFGFWQRIPNFATWDARDRLLHPLAVYSHFISDPSFESLREGLAFSREPFGATFYVYGLAILPVVLAAALMGSLDAIAAISFYQNEAVFYATWHETPKWIWTWSLALSRLANVAFSVGCVYLTYRLGTAVRNRAVGRLAAALFALSFGVIMLAHEVGEDVPALFFLLLSVYLLVRYLETGVPRRFLEASAIGGFAIAFKMTSGLVAFVILVGYLLRIFREHGVVRIRALKSPVFLGGAILGLVGIVVGFPTALVGHFELMKNRFLGHVVYRIAEQRGPEAPSWWWFLRGYFHTFGFSLAIAALMGSVASVIHVLRRRLYTHSLVLVATLLGMYVLSYSFWQGFRPHHLLPTVPLLLVLLADVIVRFRERRPSIGTLLVAVLLITTAVYAGAGTAQYASMPRDEAREWTSENVPQNATMEVYRHSFHRSAAPHWLNLSFAQTQTGSHVCPDYVQVTYRDLLYLRTVPEDDLSSVVGTNVTERRQYLRALVEEKLNYTLVAEFGPRPPNFVPLRPTPGSLLDVVKVGIWPQSDLYGDEQDLGTNQYTAVFERTGSCRDRRTLPW